MESVSVGVVLAIAFALYLRSERRATRKRLGGRARKMAELTEELDSLRPGMVASGEAERGAKLPPPPSAARWAPARSRLAEAPDGRPVSPARSPRSSGRSCRSPGATDPSTPARR